MSKEGKSSVVRVAPYSGRDDYIFISYSHRDMNTVLPILERMKKEGYRFWYDEGIDPGSEWPESIADHLGRCRVCLAFMSPSSLASQNCRREINFALSKEKDFLSVILTPVEMSPGMEMQISTYQSILKYKYENDELFFERLLGVSLLESCREKRPEPAPTPAPESSAPQASSGAPAAPKKAPPAPDDAKKRKLIIIAASAALAVILIAAAVFAVTAGRKDGGGGTNAPGGPASSDNPAADQTSTDASATDVPETDAPGTDAPETDAPDKNEEIVLTADDFVIGGVNIKDDGETVYLRDTDVTVRNMAALATLDNIEWIYVSGCNFERGALDRLSSMKQLVSLSFDNCQGIDDLDFCLGFENLQYFAANGCMIDDGDTAAITKLPIRSLSLNDNGLTSVPAMENRGNIKRLEIANNKIGSVGALSEWTSLETLNISGCGVDSLEGLEGMINMRHLNASGNAIGNIGPLSNMIYITHILLDGCGVDSLSPIMYCEKLISVSLEGNPEISDLSFLSKSAETLEKLNINGLPKITSLDFLKGCSKLTTLSANDCGIADCSALKGLDGLTYVSLSGNSITDISAFSGMGSLYFLLLENNRIASIPDLAGTGASVVSSVNLVLSGNQLVSLDGLETGEYGLLAVDGNPLSDIDALAKIKCYAFAFNCTETLPLDPVKESEAKTLYVTSVFIGKRAELESIKSKAIKYTTHEELMSSPSYTFSPDYWGNFT